MRKQMMFLFTMLIAILSLAACSSDTPEHPTTKVESYLALWQEHDFTEMYELLTEETKATFSEEDFIDRYEKIYQDLSIEDVVITYDEKDDVALELAIDEGVVDYPINVSMNSVAGPIEFSNDLSLQFMEYEEEEKDAEWLVQWNPGLIFPDLE